MTKTVRTRSALVMVIFMAAIWSTGARAPAALDMADGLQKVVSNQPLSVCNGAAKSALNAVVQGSGATEIGDSGEWIAYGAADSSGQQWTSAVIHCYPVGAGYYVTFTCAVQVPPAADSASSLCDKIATAFGGP